MKIIYTSDENVTYTQWADRVSGFLSDGNRLESQFYPLNLDSKPRIEVEVKNVLSGFLARVTYFQIIDRVLNQYDIDNVLEGETPPAEIIGEEKKTIFSYDYKRDATTTQLMLDSVEPSIPSEIVGLERIREAIKLLSIQDVTSNNVFNLLEENWNIEVD